jgi:type IV secretion/conjugal transfer VirB4 family ATPase
VLNLRSIFRNYKETAALNEHCSLFSFISDHCFLTKSGDVGVVLALKGLDYECLDQHDIDGYTKKLEAAFKLCGPDVRVYQYLFKQNYTPDTPKTYSNPVVQRASHERTRYFNEKAGELFSLEIYYVILYQGSANSAKMTFTKALASFFSDGFSAGMQNLAASWSTKKQVVLIEKDITKAEHALLRTANAFVSQITDFLDVTMLHKRDAFRMLRKLLNVSPLKRDAAKLRHDVLLDKFLVDSPIQCYRDHLSIDGYHTRVLTLREEPSESWPLILQQLLRVEATYHIVTEWRAVDNADAHKHIETMRRHFHNTKTSFTNQASGGDGSDALQDETKSAFVGDLGDCLVEIGKKGNYFGKFSLTIILYAKDRDAADKAADDFYKVFSRTGGSIYSETINQLSAFFATVPGNYHFNYRQLWITNNNYADWSFLFSLHEGERWNSHLDREALAIVETANATPYYLNLHQQIRDGNGSRTDDVAHTFILGRTGSGKSFLMNFLTTAIQKYEPYTYIFDLGGSYKKLTHLFGGTYVKLGAQGGDFTINPFSLEKTPDNIQFLYSFVKVLIEGDGDYTTTNDDDRNLHQVIDTIYSLDPSIRRLGTVAGTLPRHLADRLERWLEGGQYGFLFDNADDNLTLAKFQCFDFAAMEAYPEILQPLLFYVLHRASAVMNDPRIASTLKIFELDEAWRFFTIPAVLNYITNAARTWRKHNGILLMATQSVNELQRSDLLDIIVESFPTKIFLANPNMNFDLYKGVFHLNEKELDLISTLIPKREALLKTATMAKKFALNVDAKSYWLYTNSPKDNERFNATVQQHGFDKGLEILALRS